MDEHTEEHDGSHPEQADGADASGAATSTVLGWRALIFQRWSALGREVLGLEHGRTLKLREIANECDFLAAIVAWFENDGNITYAAAQLGTSRRSLRERVNVWRQNHPEFVPPRAAAKSANRGQRNTGDVETCRSEPEGDEESRSLGEAP